MIKLKDGTTSEYNQLDRITQFDEKSRNYPLASSIENKEWRSYTWRCNEVFDQGKDGACVAYALGHELAARPAEVRGINDRWLKEDVYWEAQKIDPWPGGSYPGAGTSSEPFYEGTSVLAGVKILHSKGFFQEYRWAFSIDELILGLGRKGPAVIGVNWFEGMLYPDSKGYIHKTGNPVGGHAVLVRGVNLKKEHVLIRNSWGMGWGKNGDCYMKIGELETLLKDRGEAVFLNSRTASPMVPYKF